MNNLFTKTIISILITYKCLSMENEKTPYKIVEEYCKVNYHTEVGPHNLKKLFDKAKSIVYLFEPQKIVFKIILNNKNIEEYKKAIQKYKSFHDTLDNTDLILSFNKIIYIDTENNSNFYIIKYAGDSLDIIKKNKEDNIIAYESVILLLPKLYVYMKEAHKRKFFIRDIKLRNICYDKEYDTLVFIDLEASEYEKEEDIVREGTFNHYSPFHIDLLVKKEPINYQINDEFAFFIMILSFTTDIILNNYFKEYVKYAKGKEETNIQNLVDIFLKSLNISKDDYKEIETHEQIHSIVGYYAFKALINKLNKIKNTKPPINSTLIVKNNNYIYEIEQKFKTLQEEKKLLKSNPVLNLAKSLSSRFLGFVSPSKNNNMNKI